MKVTVITATPNPMDVIGIAAGMCYSKQWRELMELMKEVRNG